MPKIHMVNSQHSFTPMPTIKESKDDGESWANVAMQQKTKEAPTFTGTEIQRHKSGSREYAVQFLSLISRRRRRLDLRLRCQRGLRRLKAQKRQKYQEL